jgi:hypothetical protein
VPASVAAPHLAAAAQADTLLHVTAPGRFAISTHSASGAALDVVDMIMGPTERSGTPGSADGRLDLLLDIGTYKIRTFSADGAKGSVDVLALPFVPAAPPAAVTPGAVISGTRAVRWRICGSGGTGVIWSPASRRSAPSNRCMTTSCAMW